MSYITQHLVNLGQLKTLASEIAGANAEINSIAAAEITNAITIADSQEWNRQKMSELQSQIDALSAG